jgi:hypothetical protein
MGVVMGIAEFMHAVNADTQYQEQLRDVALNAEAAGMGTPEWAQLLEQVRKYWDPVTSSAAGWPTTVATTTTDDCMATTTTTTWH